MNDVGIRRVRSADPIPRYAKPMVEAIGKLIMNCGVLEAYCTNGIVDLEKNQAQRILKSDRPWHKRSDHLIELIRKHVGDQALQAPMLQIIHKAKGFIEEFRNSFAYGMVMELNAEKEIVLMDSRLCLHHENGKFVSKKKDIRLPEINKRIDQSVDLVKDWHDVWQQIQKRK